MDFYASAAIVAMPSAWWRLAGRSCASTRPRHSCAHAHQVNIQIQRATEPPDEGDRASLGRPTGKDRFLDQVRGETTVDDAEHPAHDGRAAGEQTKAKR